LWTSSPRLDADLLEDRLDVVANRVRGQVQVRCNLHGAEAARDRACDVEFTSGQPVGLDDQGCVSRRTASETSDIDILVVRGRAVGAEDVAWREQLDRLSHDVTSWTGIDARIIEFGESEIFMRPPPVALEALSHGIDLLRGRQMLRRLTQAERE
jgi:hypothetical protein